MKTHEATSDGGRLEDPVSMACLETSLYEWVSQAHYTPFAIERAEGSVFYTTAGRPVIDFVSQLVVANLGHSLEPIHAAVYRQSRTLSYATPFAATEPRATAARKLSAITPPHINKFFFSTSGTEANNDAIRIARAITARRHILYASRSYHGGHGTAAMSSGDERRRLMEQDPTACIPFRSRGRGLHDDLVAFQATVDAVGPDKIAAVILEAVPGGSGVLVPEDGYLQQLQATCRQHGIQLICDEVLTGFGRTGRWFAFEHWDLEPDLMTVGKALSAGVAPIATVGVSDAIAEQLESLPLGCGHTFSAHPLCCVAVSAAIDLYLSTGAVDRAAQIGVTLGEQLRTLAGASPMVADVRAIGMLAAVELTEASTGEVARIQRDAFNLGVYVLAKGSNLLVAPPLVIGEHELLQGVALLGQALAS